MVLEREKYIKNIGDRFAILQSSISNRTSSNLNDLAIISEDFVKDLLNIIFDLELENLNSKAHNQVGIDLGDSKNGVAVQVTATPTREKIKLTLEKFIAEKLYEDYPHLYILMLKGRQKSYKTFDTSAYFIFDEKQNILDFNRLLNCKILFLPTKKLKQIQDFLNREIQIEPQRSLLVEKKHLISNFGLTTVHMSLGGQHAGWGGTDIITARLQNEGFHPVQLINCSAHWKIVSDSIQYELKPDTALPKMLRPGHIIEVQFKLTPLDIQDSKIDVSKYIEAPDNEWMAASIIYEVFAQIKTETGYGMSGLITYFFPRDKDKTLRVLLS